MKPPLALLALLVLSFLLFAAGAWASAHWNLGQPLATVRIENRSGQSLRYLELRFSNATAQGVLDLPAIADGQHVTAKIYVPGEGGFAVRAVLADGTVLAEGQGYVESGYRVTEVVTSSGIQSTGRYLGSK